MSDFSQVKQCFIVCVYTANVTCTNNKNCEEQRQEASGWKGTKANAQDLTYDVGTCCSFYLAISVKT